MVGNFQQYDTVWPQKSGIQDKAGNFISADSQVVILEFYPDEQVKVCRFGDYRDTVVTQLSNLSRWKAKK
jgi:hypothetical protein